MLSPCPCLERRGASCGPQRNLYCQMRLPPHGFLPAGSLKVSEVRVPLGHVAPLNLKVACASDCYLFIYRICFGDPSEVCRGKGGKKSNGAQIFIGSKTMNKWGSIRLSLARVHVVGHV